MDNFNDDDLRQIFIESFMEAADTVIHGGVSTPEQDIGIPDAPASKQQTSSYNETLDWLNHKREFKYDEKDAGKVARQLFEIQLMKFLVDNLDAWAMSIVQYANKNNHSLDMALAKVWILSQLEHTVAAVTEWQAGIAYAQKETLTSLAKAGGTSQPNVRTKWKNLDEIQKKFLAMAATGVSQTLKISDVEVQLSRAGAATAEDAEQTRAE